MAAPFARGSFAALRASWPLRGNNVSPSRRYDSRRCSRRQSCRFLETASLHPPLAALRLFPLRAKSISPRTCRGEIPIKTLSRLRTRNSARLLRQKNAPCAANCRTGRVFLPGLAIIPRSPLLRVPSRSSSPLRSRGGTAGGTGPLQWGLPETTARAAP